MFGDYDVDGVTTAAILTSALRAFGGKVVPRAASRHAGYGLGVDDVGALRRRPAAGCWSPATAAPATTRRCAAARARGIDTIVIDHHELPEGETAAYALVNSRRPDDTFPFKGLASCGVAFYLAAALRTRLASAFDPRELLDLVALGTIADLVPLVAENRILVAAGLERLSLRKRPGLAALARAPSCRAAAITAHDAAFRLTPRLNAAGRLGEAQLALDLLLAGDADAERLAGELDDQNTERQRVQELVWKEALAQASAQVAERTRPRWWSAPRAGTPASSASSPRAWSIGSRVPRSRSGFATARGGGRRARWRASTCSTRWRAARPPDEVRRPRRRGRDEHRDRRAGRVPRRLRRRGGAPARARRGRSAALAVDAEVTLGDLDLGFAEELARLAPFGVANREPLFALSGVTARATRVVGKDHLQLTLDHGGATSEAIAFGFADADPGAGARVDLVATAELDTFRGLTRTRLKVSKLARAG